MDLYIILLFFAGAAIAVVGIVLFRKYVSPWIEAKRDLIKQQIGDEQYYALTDKIKTLMASAEVQLGANTGAEKSKLVISWIKKLFPDIREDYVQALIDGFMKTLANDGIVHMKEK